MKLFNNLIVVTMVLAENILSDWDEDTEEGYVEADFTVKEDNIECNRFGHLPSEYAGTDISRTKSEKPCQKWSETDLGVHNFCRSPEGKNPNGKNSEGAWCYTTDSKSEWEYCADCLYGKLFPICFMLYN